MIKKERKLPTFIGIALLIISTVLGVLFLNNKQVFKIGASSDNAPKDVRISNITDTSFTVSWLTDKETSGYLLYGNSTSAINQTENESTDDSKYFTHTINISGLKPNTQYYFKINSGGTEFDNNGTSWQVKTGSTLGASPSQINISGNIISATGTPIDRALVYVNIGGYLLSTTTSKTGNFILQIGSTRETSLQAYKQIDQNTTLLEIFAQQNSVSVSTAQIYPKSARPIPPMIIGQTHDFRNEPASANDQEPNANLVLPEDQEKESKFNLPDATTKPSTPNVTLKSLDEGETITSTKPEFSGEGPKGQTVTIKVESENPMTGEVTIANNGSWKWAVPEGLAEGVHKITLTWKENGITRTLTRNFIVHAGELPAFEASASETLKTATPTSISTSTPKATTTPAATKTATASATAKPVPVTGNSTLTFAYLIFGSLTLMFSVYLWSHVYDN